MGAFLERLDGVAVESTSPCGAVVARFARREGITLKLADHKLSALSSDALSREVTAALRDVLAQADEAVRRAREPERADAAPDDLRRQPSESAAERRRRFKDAVSAVDVVGVSAGDLVRVSWRGVVDVDVRIKPAAMYQLSAQELCESLNAAVASARMRRGLAAAGIFRKMFDGLKTAGR
ncbi:MAG: hypothetical protein ACRDXX_07305 [Stackebrandtia sp.]